MEIIKKIHICSEEDMSYIISWSTSKLSASRTFRKREDDGRSRRSDAWNNGSNGAHRTIYKSVQNWMHEISYQTSYKVKSTK